MATPTEGTSTEGQPVKLSNRQTAKVVDLTLYGSCSLLDGSCQTCGEGAVPVVVLSISGDIANVQDREGTQAEVAIDFVPDVRAGDVLLVQAGVALSRVRGV